MTSTKVENLCNFLKTMKKERMYIECYGCLDLVIHNLKPLSDEQLEKILNGATT